MKTSLAIPFAALLLAASAHAQTPAAAPPPAAMPPAADKAPVEMKASGTPGKATAVRKAKFTATVKAVDVATRSLTLQGKEGGPETLKVGPEVKRLDEVAVGDTIVVGFEQVLVLEFQPVTAETVPPTAVATGGRASKEQAPGGAVAAGVQATVTVTAIDSAKRLVSFKGPGGVVYKVKAGPDIKLEKLKVGDRLLATYVEAVAIHLEKAKKK